MDNFEHFSRALSAMAKAGAYSARDIRDYMAAMILMLRKKFCMQTAFRLM